MVVPFPFTDKARTRRRPAAVLSTSAYHAATGHLICAMITSAARSAWPGDIPITNLTAAGLEVPCLIRLKLFSLDARLAMRQAGVLCEADWLALRRATRIALGER